MKILETLTVNHRLNILGLVGSILLLYVALSDEPWWKLVGGLQESPTYVVKLSPFIFNVSILGKTNVHPDNPIPQPIC
ncbi:MAG: hypothetical protein QXI19_11710 [Candidatus Caldarchaeum sp.]